MNPAENFLYQELVPRDQWCTWQDMKGRKVPSCKVNDPLTYLSYEETMGNYNKGFILTIQDPYVVIDLDHCCLQETKPNQYSLNPFASKIVFEMSSYTEISPSGHGLHIWVKGVIPEAIKKPNIEIYGFLRYITVTFKPWLNYPIADRQKELDVLIEELGKDTSKLPGRSQGKMGGITPVDCKQKLRQLYTASKAFRDLWALKEDYRKADGTLDYSIYDWRIACLLKDWKPGKVAWAINFFRKMHHFPPKRPGAIEITINKAKSSEKQRN